MKANKQHYIVAITGRNRVGKSTLARLLTQKLHKENINSEIRPFAQTLVDELVNIGFPRKYLKEKTQKARRLMQAYGDAKRELDSNYFIDKWVSVVNKLLFSDGSSEPGVDVIIVDDVYHLAEYATIRNMALKNDAIKVIFINIFPAHNRLPELTPEDFKYASVREQTEVSALLRGLKVCMDTNNFVQVDEHMEQPWKYLGIDVYFEVFNDRYDENYGVLPDVADTIVSRVKGE